MAEYPIRPFQIVVLEPNRDYRAESPTGRVVSLTELADWSRPYNGKTEPNTLIVGEAAAKVLFEADYAPLERRAQAHHASGDLGWPQPQTGDPADACTRLMERIPDWPLFERFVEDPNFYDSWLWSYSRVKAGWDKIVTASSPRPKFDTPPAPISGADALVMWNAR